jgi:rRNA processing protein Gar1
MEYKEDFSQAKEALEFFLNEMNKLELFYAFPITQGLKERKNVTELKNEWKKKICDLFDLYSIEHPEDFYRHLSFPVTYDLSRDSIGTIENIKGEIVIPYKQISSVTGRDRTEEDMRFYMKKEEGNWKIIKLTYFDKRKSRWIKGEI